MLFENFRLCTQLCTFVHGMFSDMSQATSKWRRRVGCVSVYRRSQQYWIYYRQGRQIRRPAGTCRDAALSLAARINAQLSEGAPTEVAFRPIPLDQLVTRWLDQHEHVRRSSLRTVQRYRTAVGHLLDFVKTQGTFVRPDRSSLEMAEDLVRYRRVAVNAATWPLARHSRASGVVSVLTIAARERPKPLEKMDERCSLSRCI